jgi:hypothetical protein
MDKSDWYYIRSGEDWKVIPIGIFTDDDAGRDEAIDVANDDAAQNGATALLYLHVDALTDLIDALERAFEETHKDFIDDDE